jgi:hypothetical protein
MAQDIAIHLFCISYADFEKLYKQNPKSPDGLGTGAIGVRFGNSADQIVKAVNKVAAGRKVRVMRMVSHGDSGGFMFPELWNVNLVSQKLAALRATFAPLGRLELHGCGIASETSIVKPGARSDPPSMRDVLPGTFAGRSNGRGLQYLRRLASVFNVPTTGAVNAQWVSGRDWGYEGDTVTVFPNAKFVMDSEGTRHWDVTAVNRAAEAYRVFIINEYVAKKKYRLAIQKLNELIKDYPGTEAAVWAKNNLTQAALENAIMRPDD